MAKRTDAQIVAEHQKRYSTARGFLAKAEASVRYWSKRAGSSHGKEMLQAAVARREVRRKQVADELKIIERHRDHTVSSVSAEGLAFVAGQEGFVANVYRDAVGVATQGYGETHGITPGRAWTRASASRRGSTTTTSRRSCASAVLTASNRTRLRPTPWRRLPTTSAPACSASTPISAGRSCPTTASGSPTRCSSTTRPVVTRYSV
jgi:hypothetical protein